MEKKKTGKTSTEAFEVSTIINAEPKVVYKAWLSSKEHSEFTGSKAKIDPKKGGAFTAWDGYISGTTLELEPFTRIKQAWRTTEFPEKSKDSIIEVLLEPAEQGTKLTLKHSNIPKGQSEEYRQGWVDYYFTPMAEYYGI
jgi:activator of HSP90 ATPase